MVNNRNLESNLSSKQSQHWKVKNAYSFCRGLLLQAKRNIIHGSIIFLFCACSLNCNFPCKIFINLMIMHGQH